MSKKDSQPDDPKVEYVFDVIEDPRAKFDNNLVDAFEEVIWRSFTLLFQQGRLEKASTRELILLLGGSIDRMDKIRMLASLTSGGDAKASLEKHRQAQERLQRFMRDYGLSRKEALELFKNEAPSTHDLIASPGQNSDAVS